MSSLPPPEPNQVRRSSTGPAPSAPPAVRIRRYDDPARYAPFAIVGAGALAIVGALLPWAEVVTVFGTLSKNGIEGDGQLTALLGAVVAILGAGVLFGWAGTRGFAISAIVMSALLLAAAAYDWQDVNSVVDESNEFARVRVGVGLWLTLGAGVLGLAASILATAATRPGR